MAIGQLLIADTRPMVVARVDVQARRPRAAPALADARPAREMARPRIASLPPLDLGTAAVVVAR